MKFEFITLFPNFFDSPLKESLIAKAQERKLIEVEIHNLRSFSEEKRRSVDDSPYGGGAGMVLKPDVLAAATKSILQENSFVILTDPTGRVFNQKLATLLSKRKHLILISGRYEGVDQRFKDKYVDMEISIGDYVLNGGEAASLVIFETVARLIPGVVGKEESLEQESFSQITTQEEGLGLLEYPQYTRPVEFEGLKVPEELLSGNHEEIRKWRLEKAREKTNKVRPDLNKENTQITGKDS